MNEKENKNGIDVAKTAGKGVKAYLSDWRNWLTHGLIGVAFLVAAIFAPVPVWLKIIVMICVICLNCLRMSKKKKKKSQEEE